MLKDIRIKKYFLSLTSQTYFVNNRFEDKYFFTLNCFKVTNMSKIQTSQD